MYKKREFQHGDIVALKQRGKWQVYIFMKASYARLWKKIPHSSQIGTIPQERNFLCDHTGSVKVSKFSEKNLRLATELIATLANELEVFRNRR